MSLFGLLMHLGIGMPRCVLCHGAVRIVGLCQACRDDFSTLARLPESLCPCCTRFSMQGTICGRCQQNTLPMVALYASYKYMPPLRQLLHVYKHQKQLYLASVLADLMLLQPPNWLDKVRFDAVLAMPLSKKRLFQRGFNQSDFLARSIAQSLGCAVLDFGLIQRQHRPAQSVLSGGLRHQNVQGIFQVDASVDDLNLLLVDDVVTTGATMNALARALKRAGAAQVFGWALSHPE